jgi:alanine dehydrogenase
MKTYISEADVRKRLKWPDLITAMERALAAFSAGHVNQPVRTVLEIDNGRGWFAMMPAHIAAPEALGAKIVTIFPENRARGGRSHDAVILLYDPRHGALAAIVDGTYITEARTAAVSALSARFLARKDAAAIGVLGSGTQARSHVEALREVMPVQRLRAWSPNRGRLARFAAEMNAEAAANARSAVEGADVIVLATSSYVPVIENSWVRDGAHVIAMGACRAAHRETPSDLIARGRVFVDSREAAMKEAGDVLLAIEDGSITRDHVAGELGEVILGKIRGRESPEQVTIFKSLGLAVEDVAAARLVYDQTIRPS